MPKKTDNRRSLLEAGLAILAEKPPEEVSLDEIAARAGVTKPMVYYYFGNKVGFYQNLVQHVEDVLNSVVDECIDEGISFRTTLKRIIVQRISYILDHPEFSNAIRIMLTSRSICGAESRSRITRLFNRLEPVFRKQIEEGNIRTDADLQLVMAMLNTLIEGAFRIHGREYFKTIDEDEFAEMIVAMIFDGIGTGKREKE